MTDVSAEPSLRRQLLHGGTISVLMRALAVGLSFVLSVVLARVLGPAQYGLYAAVFALITILAMPVKLGLPTLVVRETAGARAGADWPRVAGIWRWSTRVVVIASALVVPLVLGGLWLLGDGIGAERRVTVLWALPLIPLMALAGVRAAALRGLARVFFGQLPDKVLRPFVLVALILLAVFGGHQLGAEQAMALHVLAAGLALLAGAGLLWAAQPAPLREVTRPTYAGGPWIRAIVPLSAIAGLQILSQNTDLLMLALFRSDAEVGLYRVALNGASLVIFGLTAIGSVMQPHIVRLYRQGDTARLQRMATAASRLCLLMTLPVVLALALFGPQVLSLLFGAEYRAASPALIILALAQMCNAFFGSAGAMLSMSGHEDVAMRALAASTALNLGLNAALIPPFGMTGAAVATGLSVVVWNVLFWRAARQRLGVDTSPLGLWPGAKA